MTEVSRSIDHLIQQAISRATGPQRAERPTAPQPGAEVSGRSAAEAGPDQVARQDNTSRSAPVPKSGQPPKTDVPRGYYLDILV